jgi:excinuclease UvrABC nuclease subunit
MAELYRHFDGQGTLLYVGISASAVRRLTDHKTQSAWFSLIAVKVEHFPTRTAARKAEITAITKERPLYNIKGAITPSSALPELPSTSKVPVA